MAHKKNELSLQKKIAPPIEGEALLNMLIITLFVQKAS
jgi:hypothetical protein